MTNSMQKSHEKQITQTSDHLFETLQSVIKDVKKQVSTQVNSALTLLYWHIGKQIYNELLQQQRAEYGQAIVKALSRKLTDEFGKGFNYSALTRMQKFYSAFPEEPIVATLSQQLNWSHIVELDRTDIHVGEYLTALPSKEQLQNKLHQVMASRLDAVSDATDLAKGE